MIHKVEKYYSAKIKYVVIVHRGGPEGHTVESILSTIEHIIRSVQRISRTVEHILRTVGPILHNIQHILQPGHQNMAIPKNTVQYNIM